MILKGKRLKPGILPVFLLCLVFGGFMVYQMITTYRAHDTFEGYCAWRGLVVESKEQEFGYCKNPSDNTRFKIVLFKGRWFLDGDLPCGFLCW
jgi:hypothetical protein